MNKDFRSICFESLFESDLDIKEFIMVKNDLSVNQTLRAEQLLKQISDNFDEIILLIKKYSQNWSFERIAKTEKTSLILGIGEIKLNLTPPKVVVSEWTKLTDKHSTSDGAKFVNAILDNISKNEFNN
jgi:transcription termination factor NusB